MLTFIATRARPRSTVREDRPRLRLSRSVRHPHGSLLPLGVAALLGAMLAFAGCSDAPTATRRMLVPARPLASISDGGLDYNDSWVSETDVVAESTTVSSTQPFPDPWTDQDVTSLQAGTEAESVSVLAGYGYDGQMRITTGYATPDPLATSTVREAEATTYDASGSDSLGYAQFDDEPIATLGSLASAQLDVTPTTDPTDPCATAIDYQLCESQQTTMTRAPLAPGGGIVTYRALSPDRFQTRELSTSSSSALPGAAHRRMRDYARMNGIWTLVHVMDEITATTSSGTIRHVVHQSMHDIQYHPNHAKDVERFRNRGSASRGSMRGASLTLSPWGRPELDVTCDATSTDLIVACTEPTSSGSTGTSDPPAPDQSLVVSTASAMLIGNGGMTGLVLEHGFYSDARTWGRMQNWLNAGVAHGGMDVPTTTWSATYENQALNQLAPSVSGRFGLQPVVLIGHSNGGMISRYLAQQKYGSGTMTISGVITIGSPHWGAPLGGLARGVTRLLGIGNWGALLMCAYTDTAGCRNFTTAIGSGVTNSYAQYGSGVPVLNDMQWHDAYHTSFNSVAEGFQHFGIASNNWNKWLFWRHYGDTFCYEDSSCGGSQQVKKVDRIYHHDITCAIITGIFWDVGDAAKCVADAAFLRAIDNLYIGYVKGPGDPRGSQQGDGVVPLSSQTYPNTVSQNLFLVEDGPAHTGETSDRRVYNYVLSILTNRLQMTPMSP